MTYLKGGTITIHLFGLNVHQLEIWAASISCRFVGHRPVRGQRCRLCLRPGAQRVAPAAGFWTGLDCRQGPAVATVLKCTEARRPQPAHTSSSTSGGRPTGLRRRRRRPVRERFLFKSRNAQDSAGFRPPPGHEGPKNASDPARPEPYGIRQRRLNI